MARKTFTSTEVKNRWKKANYKIYQLNLRYDTDADLIAYVESHKEKDGTTEIFRAGIADAGRQREN